MEMEFRKVISLMSIQVIFFTFESQHNGHAPLSVYREIRLCQKYPPRVTKVSVDLNDRWMMGLLASSLYTCSTGWNATWEEVKGSNGK